MSASASWCERPEGRFFVGILISIETLNPQDEMRHLHCKHINAPEKEMQAVTFKHVVNPQQDVTRNQQANLTFRNVLQAARRIQSAANRELALYVIQCAVDNADDTCVLEQAQPLTEWDAIFRGSVESVLAYTTWAARFHGTVGQLRITRNHLNAFFAKFGLVG